MTTLLHRTIQSPTAVELSVWSKFVNGIDVNLCVAKANVLEIYKIHRSAVGDEDEDDEDDEEDEEEENDEENDEEMNERNETGEMDGAERETHHTSLRLLARYPMVREMMMNILNLTVKKIKKKKRRNQSIASLFCH